MAVKYYVLILFLAVQIVVLQTNNSFGQENRIERIQLTWNSFRKTMKPELPYIAYTAHKTFYKYRATLKGNTIALKFDVRIMLDTPNTTVNLKRLMTLSDLGRKRLLEHEQGHTDLAVIYGRLLYQSLSKEAYTPTNFKTKTRAIYLQLMKRLAEENYKYDVSTEHGFNEEKQREWASVIGRKLKLFI
jgi:predicted secreted Zn-dependent protease